MKEVITTKYERNEGLVPTFQLRSVPIDGIFISEVNITSRWYFPFRVSLSDHKVLWVKLKVDARFRYNFYHYAPVVFRRLKYNDPRIVNRFQKLYVDYLKEHNLFIRIKEVENRIQNGRWDKRAISEYKATRSLRYKGIIHADKYC